MNEPERDIQKLWHDQPREEHAMSIDEIRASADRFTRKVHRWNIVTGVIVVLVIVLDAWQMWKEPSLLDRVGDVLTTAALLYVVYRYREYSMVQPMPAGLGLTTSVDFYRQQLARQRDLASNPWRSLALFIPGVALSFFGDAMARPAAQTAGIAILGVALFLGVAWLNARTARKVQREIDERD